MNVKDCPINLVNNISILSYDGGQATLNKNGKPWK